MAVSTPDLCDEHGDQVQVAEPVFKHYGGKQNFHGKIVTVKCFEDNSKVAQLVRTAGNARVLVVDGKGSKRCSLLGDQLALAAYKNNWSGVVVYGAIRDVDDINTMDIGVMAVAAIPRKTQKLGQGEINCTLDIAGVVVEPGHYIYADNNGVIISKTSLL